MNRNELAAIISHRCDAIKGKFESKNQSYGADDDALYNFRKTAERFLGNDSMDSMFRTAMVFMDKHMTTLAKNGINDKECGERLMDIIVYSMIMYAMWEVEYKSRLPKVPSKKLPIVMKSDIHPLSEFIKVIEAASALQSQKKL